MKNRGRMRTYIKEKWKKSFSSLPSFEKTMEINNWLDKLNGYKVMQEQFRKAFCLRMFRFYHVSL